MNDSRYKIILYVIIAVIVGTISIQAYWNYKNYGVNKQQLISEVQSSLDSAVETYYANLAERSTYAFAIEATSQEGVFEEDIRFDSIFRKLNIKSHRFNDLDSVSVNLEDTDGIQIFRGQKADSLISTINKDDYPFKKGLNRKIGYHTLDLGRPDSLTIDNFKTLTTKVLFSLSQDTLNLVSIDSLVKTENLRKNLDISYGLSINTLNQNSQFLNKKIIESSSLSALSKSTYLPKESSLKIHFTNTTKEILKRNLTGILLSTLLILVVISCLFYLLKIIKHQKQLAEVKNDFISNITHEFKTPIATIGVALESIKDFNVISNKERTTSYIEMSNNQLKKLNVMVEKLLETASLDSENLRLNKEECNVSNLIQNLVTKHSLDLEKKSLEFINSNKDITAKVDVFHFENAINNILDNALKYGGNTIKVSLNQNTIGFTVSISDDGNTIAKINKDKIFEKFYRIPKGNTHDVKGFGIGLYYTKKIIEKHDGAIHLNLDDHLTTFKISVPNG